MTALPIRTRSISPAKAGRIYGTFIPSPVAQVTIRTPDGELVKKHMSRSERRKLRRIE